MQLALIGPELGYEFRNKALLKQALTHSSALSEPRVSRSGSNERLATLGDAVLDLVVAARLYSESKGSYLTSAKGDLTIERSGVVSNKRLAEFSSQLGLQQHLVISLGQKKNIGISDLMLAQVYEAIVGAIFLDSSYEQAKEFIHRTVLLGDETA